MQAYAHRHLGPEDANDVLSEVYLVAWRRIGDVPAQALPWLIVTARNVIHTRRRGTAREWLDGADPETRFAALATPDPDPAEAAVDRDLLLGALASLSEDDRETLLLVAWEGLTNRQAAAATGCSESTFRVRLHRARTRLESAIAAADSAAGSDDVPAGDSAPESSPEPAPESFPASSATSATEGTRP